jgi:cardiolipin synthase (CMP-forming)
MYLTLLRIAVIPVMVLLWEYPIGPAAWILFVLFAFASITDYIDGHLARIWNVTSDLGAMLDQIADKLLIVTVLVMLTYDHHIPASLTIILILRELLVSGLREYAGMQSLAIPVSQLGKAKAALQMIGLCDVLLSLAIERIDLLMLGHIILALSAVFSWVSAWGYVRAVVKR